MSTKLSEIISVVWSDDDVTGTGVTKSEYRAMYDAARALEERVGDLDHKADYFECMYEAALKRESAATARAEAAETRATNLDRQCDDLGEELERIEKQLYEACGERDVAEHEVARLKAVALSHAKAAVAARDELDALRAKLEKYEACCALNGTTCGNNYCCGEGDR